MTSFVIVSFKIQPDHQVSQIYDRRGSLSLNRTIICPISRRVGLICWSSCLIIKTIGYVIVTDHMELRVEQWSRSHGQIKVTVVYASGNIDAVHMELRVDVVRLVRWAPHSRKVMVRSR